MKVGDHLEKVVLREPVADDVAITESQCDCIIVTGSFANDPYKERPVA